jgi:uncharacterized OB-fold protein
MTTAVRPIAPDLIEVDGDVPYLIGGRRKSDSKVAFPLPPETALYERVRLPREGRLWAFTVQRFRPKTPPYAGVEGAADFKPYAVGYVELPGHVIVESRLDVDDFADLKIGLPMSLATEVFHHSGGDALTYVFRPTADPRGNKRA